MNVVCYIKNEDLAHDILTFPKNPEELYVFIRKYEFKHKLFFKEVHLLR